MRMLHCADGAYGGALLMYVFFPAPGGGSDPVIWPSLPPLEMGVPLPKFPFRQAVADEPADRSALADAPLPAARRIHA